MDAKSLFVKILQALIKRKNQEELKGIKSILIIKQHDQIGDLVQILPSVKALRNHFQNAHITALTRPYTREILLHNPLIDNLVSFYSHPKYWIKNTPLIKRRYDLGIAFNTVSHSLTSDLIGFLLCKNLLGPSLPLLRGGERNFLYNIESEAILEGQQWERYASVLKPLGIEMPKWEGLLYVTEEEAAYGRKLLLELTGMDNPPAIHPFHRDPRRRWDRDKFIRLIRFIVRETQSKPVIIWGPGEERFKEELETILGTDAAFIPPISLRGLMSVLANVRFLLGTDTATYHIAAALGKPTLTIYGDVPFENWLPPVGLHLEVSPPEGHIEELEYDDVEQRVKGFLSALS